MPIRGIIFDMDDVFLLSSSIHATAYRLQDLLTLRTPVSVRANVTHAVIRPPPKSGENIDLNFLKANH
jgi:hypothetical protein